MFFRSLIWCLRNLHFVCSQISFFDHFLILWFCIDLVMPFRCCVCHAAQWFACLDLAFGMCYLGWKPPENWENSMGIRWDPSSARSIACLPEVEKSAVDWFLTEDMSRWVDRKAAVRNGEIFRVNNFSGIQLTLNWLEHWHLIRVFDNWKVKTNIRIWISSSFFFGFVESLKGLDVSQVGIEFKISMGYPRFVKKKMAPFEVAIARTAVNQKWKSSSLNDHQWRPRHAKT